MQGQRGVFGVAILWLMPLVGTGCGDGEASLDAAPSDAGSIEDGAAADTGASDASSVSDSGTSGTTTSTTSGGPSPLDLDDCDFINSCLPGVDEDSGTEIELGVPEDQAEEFDSLSQALTTAAAWDHAALSAKYPVSFSSDLGYVPSEAQGMSVLQDTSLALVDDELERLDDLGFVITDKTSFPNFVYGYELLYALDLPLFVSADSVLFAVHQSYDTLLARIEMGVLIPALTDLLDSARNQLEAGNVGGFTERTVRDVDLYLAVASSLLSGELQEPVAGANRNDVGCLLSGVSKEDGCVEGQFFGTSRVFDFSQFTIRGHYTDSVELGQYFQAMMWLGRIDLRLLETVGEHTQAFRRRQLEAALLLRWLLDDSESRRNWATIDGVVTAFVGQHDSMTLPQLDDLLEDLGVQTLEELSALSDEDIAQAIVDGGYGAQRISSHIMAGSPTGGTRPLSSTFLLFGQRYLADSHVFSNVVYDRVPERPGYPDRMMPDPLDAAFAALGNNQALQLLDDELETYAYAPQLGEVRILIDELGSDYWTADLYNRLLSALRELSPGEETASPAGSGLPAVAGTEAWGRRILNTQLASWAELRHDTLLYAKQSYTAGQPICEYPDAYVDPYPEFWHKLVDFAEHGLTLASEHGLGSLVTTYFSELANSATILAEMAENQRAGIPHTAEQLEFINRAVRTQHGGGGCGGVGANAVDAEGWYADLFFEAADRVAYDPSIADVHTQPTNEIGEEVGRILHVATGTARQMVMTVDTCEGPKAYVGLVSSYFERITEDFERLTDEVWAQEIFYEHPEDVAWMQPLVVR